MSHKVTLNDGKKYYAVLFDNNKDGAKDEVYFDDKEVASLFEDCFVAGQKTERCNDWLLGQAQHTYDDIGGIQYKTAGGRNSKFCEPTYWQRALDNFKGLLNDLRDGMGLLSPMIVIDMGKTLFDYSLGKLSDKDAKDYLGGYLVLLNEASGNNISDNDLNFIKELVWKNRHQMLSGIKLFYQVENQNEMFQQLISDVDEQCFAENKEYCIDREADRPYSNQDLIEIHRRFGRFDSCMPYAPRYSNGQKAYEVLDQDTNVDGVIYPKDSYIEYHENGLVAEGFLARKQDVMGRGLPAGTKISYETDGFILSLAIPEGKSAEIEGVEYVDYANFYSGYKAVSKGRLARDQKITGVLCKGGSEVEYFENYDFKSGTLKGAQLVDGVALGDGDKVFFYQSKPTPPALRGDLNGIKLSEPRTIQDIYCGPGGYFYEMTDWRFPRPLEDVTFAEDGSLRFAKLEDAQYVDGVLLPKNTSISLTNGQLTHAYLEEDAIINGIKWPKSSDFRFYPGQGQIAMAGRGKKMTVQGIRCESVQRDRNDSFDLDSRVGSVVGSGNPYRISFHPNGQLYVAYLDGEQTIQGVKVPDYSRVEFDENGKLVKIKLTKDAVVNGRAYNKATILKVNGPDDITVSKY